MREEPSIVKGSPPRVRPLLEQLEAFLQRQP
jgi:hypothetical protein